MGKESGFNSVEYQYDFYCYHQDRSWWTITFSKKETWPPWALYIKVNKGTYQDTSMPSFPSFLLQAPGGCLPQALAGQLSTLQDSRKWPSKLEYPDILI